jgi:hypothetical protein
METGTHYFECLACGKESPVYINAQPRCEHCKGGTGIVTPTPRFQFAQGHAISQPRKAVTSN